MKLTHAVPMLLLLATACATNPATPPATQPAMQPVAATQSAPPPCPVGTADLDATLWMQTSAEYAAITREVYATARRTLDVALADPTWVATTEEVTPEPNRQPAIILDLDETAIDTSPFTAQGIRSNTPYSDEVWAPFALAGNARAIAPALDFVKYAQSRGVAVFYVTNRIAAHEAALRRNLETLGFPLDANMDNVLTKGERPEWSSSDKSPRRAFVAGRYRVVMLFGDDLNDFVAANGKSIADRAALVARYDDNWGRRWFVLPNPMYGSWESAAVAGAHGPCAEFEQKLNLLRTGPENQR